MNETTDGDSARCRPLAIDFDQLADQIRAGASMRRVPLDTSKSIEHTARHLREELPDLDDRQIARVMLTASVLTAQLVESTSKWKATGIVNVLAATGERLWREDRRVGDELTLRDVDPAWVAECEEADRIAEKVYEPGPADAECEGAPF